MKRKSLEAFADPDIVDLQGRKHSFFLLAQTEAGRLLKIAYKMNKDGSSYVFHAMDAGNEQQAILYKGLRR